MNVRHILSAMTILAAACSSSTEPIFCTTEFVFGVTITVTDATTGQPIREGISGRLQEGSYSEDMEHFDNRLLGAGERAGTYTATVNGTGYEQWTESGIVVTADECHVRPVALEARLTPSG